jgi:DNA-binding GntR family transcriptional regulator
MLANDLTINGGKTATAYGRILEDIVLGRRPPGSPIDREAVARDLGISVQPVTTAIDQLALDGFVDIRLQKGSYVAPVRLTRMIEATFVIAALIRASFRFVAADPQTPTMRALDAALETIRRRGETGDFHGLIRGVRAYRAAMVDACEVTMARVEASRAGAYLHWSIDQVLRASPPDSHPEAEVRGLCDKLAAHYTGLHKALRAGNAMRHATQLAALYRDQSVTFRQLAELFPSVVEA